MNVDNHLNLKKVPTLWIQFSWVMENPSVKEVLELIYIGFRTIFPIFKTLFFALSVLRLAQTGALKLMPMISIF